LQVNTAFEDSLTAANIGAGLVNFFTVRYY
jgi:hypothetical protein